jgi:uncharacterized protein YndB with AHSA1/START domain
MDTEQRIKARVTRRFSASPQRVFDAWLDPTTAGKWLFATPTGTMICTEIDARAGGWFYIVERRNGENVEYIGEYLELVRPRRLVFTLLAERYSLDFDRVTVEVQALGNGCELSLAHETMPQFVQEVSRDWIEALDALSAVLSEDGDAAARELAVRAGNRRMVERIDEQC